MPKQDSDDHPKGVIRFQHGGRQYSLFKRMEGRNAPFYVHFQSGQKRHLKSLETNNKQAAIARAKKFIEAVRNERWDDLGKLKAHQTKQSTLQQVFDIYPNLAMIGRRSAKNNVLAMRIVAAAGTSEPLNAEEFTLDRLTAELISNYQAATIDRYCREAQQDENSQREARDRAGRTSRSYVGQARSLFNHRMGLPEKYAAAGIILPPSLGGFMNCKLLGKQTKREYFVPPDKVVKAAFTEIHKLRKSPLAVDRNAFLAFWFAVGAGLRRREIQHLRWEHLVERDGATWVSGGLGKDGEQIEVPMQTKAVEAVKPLRKKAGFVLTERGLEWAKRLSWWMRDQGWQTEKKLHELRAYVGSMIYRQNPVAAMKFMRHKSIRITEQFYVRYGVRTAPVDVL